MEQNATRGLGRGREGGGGEGEVRDRQEDDNAGETKAIYGVVINKQCYKGNH